jgi:hypothetical protein
MQPWSVIAPDEAVPAHARDRLPSPDQVWSWLREMNGFGPRLTGTQAHRDFIDLVAGELASAGLATRRDTLHVSRWEAQRSSLHVLAADGAGEEELPVTSCYPYSGVTPAGGVEGGLVYYRRSPWSYRDAAAKIAVVDIAVPRLPRWLAYLLLRRRGRPRYPAADLAHSISSPLLAWFRFAELARAATAGVLGLVCVWRNCSEANAAGQYLPFSKPYQDCPALWVSAATGDRLENAARRGARARLTLDAVTEPRAPSDTLYAELPGSDPGETIIVNTHTDGPNACQENGAVGLLALATAFSRLPLEQRRRSLIFVFVTGHFRLPDVAAGRQATSTWLRQHPELWDGQPGHRKAVAGMTLEHLGAMEWKDDSTHRRYGATGRPELELVFTGNRALDRIYRDSLARRRWQRSLTLRPVNDIHLGEGQPLFQVGIPAVALVPIPDYLCAVIPGGGMERLNKDFMYEQIQTFADVLEVVDRTPTADLGEAERQPRSVIRRLLRFTAVT